MAPDGHAVDGQRPAARAAIRSRSATTCFTRVSISSTKRSARRPAICLAASRWYGSATLSSSVTSQARPDQVAEAGRRHRPRLGEGAGDDQAAVPRRPGRAPTRARTDRRPRRPPAGPAPGRRRRGRLARWPRARPGRWGCWASTGRSRTASAEQSIAGTPSRSSVKSAPSLALHHRGAGEAGDVRVQLVGRLERRPRAARPGDRPAAGSGAPRSSRWPRRPARPGTPWSAPMASRSSRAERSG